MPCCRESVQSLITDEILKVALDPLRRIFLNFAKDTFYHVNYNSIIKNWGHRARFLSYKRLKLKLRVLLAGHIVAMVAYCAIKTDSNLFTNDWAVF